MKSININQMENVSGGLCAPDAQGCIHRCMGAALAELFSGGHANAITFCLTV